MAKKFKSSISLTKGRRAGHYFRRALHVSLCVIPFIYYPYQIAFLRLFQFNISWALWALLLIVVALESLRLKFGWVAFGQREYEANQVSAFAWGLVGIILVLLLSPGMEFSLPIIWGLALGDPLLGELRQRVENHWLISLIGFLLLLSIWWACAYWFSISWWWGVVLAPVTVGVEALRLKWIDDNALMLLVPLFIVIIGENL